MKVSRQWLQNYIEETLPNAEEIASKLTMTAFEIEGIEKHGDDDVIDVKILPDRAHYALSHYGIATDIAVAFGFKLKPRNKIELPKVSENLNVEIQDTRLCRRYTGAIIKGVKVGPSPDWLKVSLEAVGQRSINNIVDATNYVLFSIGQPTHVFDLSKLVVDSGKSIVKIQKLKAAKKFMALDSKEYELKEGTLVIVDENNNKTLAIAGVKGGSEALVDNNTTDILLESANFDPVTVRKTGRGLGLVTDAQKRFENELTPELAIQGLSDLIKLITEIAGGIVDGYVDVYPKPVKLYKVGVSLSEINSKLGVELSAKQVEEIINKFGWEHACVTAHDFIPNKVKEFVGKPYKWGASVLYDAPESFDCSSLTSYLYKESGVQVPRITVDQFIFSKPINESELVPGDVIFSKTKRQINMPDTETKDFMKGTIVTNGVSHCGVYIGEGKVIHAADPEGVLEERLKESKRFAEIVGYGRMATVGEKRWVVTVPHERLDLRIKEDLIEEIGRIYGYNNIEAKPPVSTDKLELNKEYYYCSLKRAQMVAVGYTEVYNYAFRDKGEIEIENPLASDKGFMRTNLSDGIKESLEFNLKNIDLLGLDEIKIFEIGKVFDAQGERLMLCKGKINKKKKIEVEEIDLGKEIENLAEVGEMTEMAISSNIFIPVSAYPFIVRDIALWTSVNTSPEEIVEIIKDNSGELLIKEPQLFDKFTKEGKTSYGYRMIYQSMDKTLTDEEVNAIMNKITEIMNNEEGWQVR